MAIQRNTYDGDLQMFIDAPREPDMARLTFLRWLVERRRLEHEPAGAPAGDFAVWSAVSTQHKYDREAA